MNRHWLTSIVIFLVVSWAGTVATGDGVHIGRSRAGKLKIEIEPEFSGLIALDPIEPGGPFEGWSGSDPGFINELDEGSGDDFLPLYPGASIWLEAVLIDPAFVVIGTDFRLLEDTGDDTFLGDSCDIFDAHPTYLINSEDERFDPNQCVWEATVFLRDDGSTMYEPSDAFTLSFTNIPERSATGDFDGDNDVDIDDFALFTDCMAGPNLRPDATSACEPDCLNAFDFDGDNDIDLQDAAQFQIVFTGT